MVFANLHLPPNSSKNMNMNMRFPTLIFILLAVFALSANKNQQFNFSKSLDRREAKWVDSVFQQLTLDERIGQLFVLRAHSDKDAAYEMAVENQVRQFKPGGLCFFQGTPERQAVLTNRYQNASPIPLMISMDAEWGLGMRLKESTISFPKQLMLGALRDNRPIYEMGLEVARQCRRLGVHLNFAPDADINNNAANPVINDRSFGEDRYNVAAKCFQYAKGMQDGGILACAKHFPGHGDTNVDSHFDLPIIAHSTERLDSLELFPFRILSQFGVGSAMVAHLSVPALDSRPNRPTTLSERTVHGLLRKSIGFDGLIFTDAMEMKALAKYFEPGEADVEALRAGNDVILLPGNMAAALDAVKKALEEKTLFQDRFEASVKRVLRAKYRLGLTKPQHVEVENIRRDLNPPSANVLKRQLIRDALTLVRDRPGVVPFPEIEKFRFASLAIGDTSPTVFQKSLGQFAPMKMLNAPSEITPILENILLDSLRGTDVVFVSLHNMRSKAADNFGFTESEINFIQRLNDVSTVVLTVFGNPYSLKFFEKTPVLLEAFNEDPNTQDLAAQALFGAVDLKGSLPVTVSPGAKFGDGLTILNKTHRLGYDLPESVGMNSDSLAKMDALVQTMISTGAAPGCQVLVAKNGKVVWQKSYGFFTYENLVPVTNSSIFDMASVTKVAATTISLMKLAGEKKFNLNTSLSQYLPELKNTNKQFLTGEEMLAHHAGLTAWIPFYEKTVDKNGFPNRHIYHAVSDHDSKIPVAPGMFMENVWVDTIWQTIFISELRSNKSYKYSDLGLILCARALKNISGKSLDVFADENFYRPLGLATTTFNPWKKGLTARCLPTEEDRYFRQQRVQGYVHDMGSAMLGGVAGHAGLFSTANDLAKIFQMLLNRGEYFGKKYLEPEIVGRWTTRFSARPDGPVGRGSTRRGIGFDMKELNPTETQNMSEFAGEHTFGHMGFTGISVWADPEQDLIFIFCSNRTYPTMKNNLLISENYRPRIQSIVYQAIVSKKPN